MTEERVLRGPRPLRGRLRVPGDKSISHRALVFAGVAAGTSHLRGLATGDDVARTRTALEALGVEIDGGGSVVRGRGWDGLREPGGELDCGNSGTSLRVLCGLVAGRPFTTTLTGDASLRRRPMRRVAEPLRAMGAEIVGRAGGEHAPLTVTGGGLRGIRHEMPVASAQVKSALILAGLQAEGVTEVVEPASSRDHTERMLGALGLPVEVHGTAVRVEAGDVPAFDLEVPGDPSSAAFFLVGAVIIPGSEVTVEGVSVNPRRLGFVEVLRRMGAAVEVVPRGEVCGEPVGDLRAASSPLVGTCIGGAEIPSLIDEIPALALAAAWAEGETEIRDAAELVVKESNRIGSIEQELMQLGVAVRARRDGVVIRGGPARPGRLKSHGDHRIAMMAAVAATAVDGVSRLAGWQAASVSYPEFFDDLEALAGDSRGAGAP